MVYLQTSVMDPVLQTHTVSVCLFRCGCDGNRVKWAQKQEKSESYLHYCTGLSLIESKIPDLCLRWRHSPKSFLRILQGSGSWKYNWWNVKTKKFNLNERREVWVKKKLNLVWTKTLLLFPVQDQDHNQGQKTMSASYSVSHEWWKITKILLHKQLVLLYVQFTHSSEGSPSAMIVMKSWNQH